jgi:transglutaminase-like putative cysteine protease
MKSPADFYFQSSVNLLLGVAFTALASTGKVDIPSILCFVFAYAVYLSLSFRQRAAFVSARRVSFFAKLYMLIFVVDMLWLSGSFVNAAIHLLLFIQILKFFSEKKDKDFFYLILIAFMELLTAAAMTISASFFFAFLIFLALVISTLVSFEIKRSQESAAKAEAPQQRRKSAVGFPLGDGGRKLYGALAATSMALSLGIVGMGALIFFALPRVEGGFFSRAESPMQTITGFSSTVQFGDVGSIKRNMALVMRVEIEGNPRGFEGVKWRGIALNFFDGRAWYRTLSRGERPLARDGSGNYRVPPEQVPPPHRLLRYRIMLEPVSTEVLFAAAQARLIQTKARVRIDPADSLETDYHPSSRIRYEAISDLGTPAASTLRVVSSAVSAEIERDYLALPQLDSRVYSLAKQITRADTNNYDRARSVERYLRENFGYTLDLPRVREEDPITQFLFETKRGHCEYFASSMAILLRTIGIPTRLVNGFQTGEFNQVGDDFIVREADAHSWVEVFFPGHGWIAFDPTPPAPAPSRSAALVSLNHYLDALELFWINWVVGYDSFRQVTLFQDLQHRSLDAKHWAERVWAAFNADVSSWLRRTFFAAPSVAERSLLFVRLRFIVVGGAFLLALVAVGIASWLIVRWKRGWQPPQPQWVAKLFSQWLRTLAGRGYVKRASQTALEFSHSISDPAVRSIAIELALRYNSLRFDPAARLSDNFRNFQTRLRWAKRNV